MKKGYLLGSDFEKFVGRPLSDFRTPKAMEDAMEEKLGHPLKSVTINPEETRKESERIIKKSYALLKNLE